MLLVWANYYYLFSCAHKYKIVENILLASGLCINLIKRTFVNY